MTTTTALRAILAAMLLTAALFLIFSQPSDTLPAGFYFVVLTLTKILGIGLLYAVPRILRADRWLRRKYRHLCLEPEDTDDDTRYYPESF